VIELTTEMALAIRSLPLRKTKDSRKGTNDSSAGTGAPCPRLTGQ